MEYWTHMDQVAPDGEVRRAGTAHGPFDTVAEAWGNIEKFKRANADVLNRINALESKMNEDERSQLSKLHFWVEAREEVTA
jgi:hypothetical protein